MKIGLISTAYAIPTPPTDFGGMERINWWLATELVKRGHELTLFGCEGSHLEGAKEVVILPGGGEVHPREGGPYPPYFDFMTNWMSQQSEALEVWHDSSHHHELARRLDSLPSVSTVHNPNPPESKNSIYLSNFHRHHLGQGHAPFVMNGAPEGEYLYGGQKEDYVLFMGAFGHHKGFDIAIEFSRYYQIPMKIAGFPMGADEQRILQENMEHPNIEYLGVIGGIQKLEVLAKAKACLMPFRWPEPGCILAVECMASGTPIIGSSNGVLPEYIVDGQTGFITHGRAEDLYSAFLRLDEISPEACYQRFYDHFRIQRVAQQYEEQYRRAIAGERW